MQSRLVRLGRTPEPGGFDHHAEKTLVPVCGGICPAENCLMTRYVPELLRRLYSWVGMCVYVWKRWVGWRGWGGGWLCQSVEYTGTV